MTENKATELFRKHCAQQIVGSGSIPDFDEAFKYVFSTYKEELIKKMEEKFNDVIGKELHIKDGVLTGMVAITRDGIVDMKNDIINLIKE